MKVLVIGNGFDKAHELQTSYTDFLDFYLDIDNSYRLPCLVSGEDAVFEEETGMLHHLGSFGGRICNEFYAIRYCSWIQYFRKRREYIGKDWNGFEAEIEKTIKGIVQSKYFDGEKRVDLDSIPNEELWSICKAFHKEIVTYYDWLNHLNVELKNLCRALEIYMDAINLDKPEVLLPQISALNVDKVLSFNYTNTYTNLYNPNVTIDVEYIHGMANAHNINRECNLVLGFDDHYFEKADVTSPDIIPFEKYYQRIVNRTGNKVYEWIDEMKKAKENIVYFFGHSLSPMDGDIVKTIVEIPNTKTFIFYTDEKDRAIKIKNLAIVLGAASLIRLAGGASPKIEFKEIVSPILYE